MAKKDVPVAHKTNDNIVSIDTAGTFCGDGEHGFCATLDIGGADED